MPLVTHGSKDNPDENLTASLSSTNSSSPALTPRKWSHKKFGYRKQSAVPKSRERRHTATQSTPSLTAAAELGNSTRRSPRSPSKEEKKRKRRESDAKWRSNISVCFKHLEAKVVRARHFSKTRLSKEMIVQKTVQKVQYLEAIFMLLNQADRQSTPCEFSPVRGLQSLQSARREFAHKFFYKSTDRLEKRSNTNTAVKNPDPTPALQDGVVPENSQNHSEQSVPLSVTSTAGRVMKNVRGNKFSSKTGNTATKQKGQQDRAVPSTPTKSLMCEEQDLDSEDQKPKTFQFNTKDPKKDGFKGHASHFQAMTSPRRKAPAGTAQIPSQSPIKSSRSVVPTTPSFYSPDRPLARSPLTNTKADVDGHVVSKKSHFTSPARKNGGAVLQRSQNNPIVTCPAGSPAAKYDRVAPHWPAYYYQSPAKSPAKSPSSSGLTSPCRVPCWSPPQTTSPLTRGGSVALSYRDTDWNPPDEVSSRNGSAFRYHPPSPARSPATSQRMADYIRPLEWSPTRTLASALATSPARSYESVALVSSSDLVMSSPSKRYKIVGKSIMSLGDAEPGTWEVPPSPVSDIAGRSTPDLTCQEEMIPSWKENKSKKPASCITPCSRSTPFPSSASHPPPPKKCPAATWSAKFVNDVRQSQPSLAATQTKSKRCKRLFYDEIEKKAAGETNSKKQKFDDSSDIKKKRPRRKYHKRATAARIRPWDPLSGKVSSPVRGIPRQQNNQSRKSKSLYSSAALSAELGSPQHQPKTNLCGIQNKPSRRKSQTPRKYIRGGLRALIKKEQEEEQELGVEEIIEVEEVDPESWTKDSCLASNNRQLLPDKSNVDHESSQGSLLLSEIPQLPDEIITPLLLSGESEQYFLEDFELERTLQPEMYAASASASRLKTTKSDDEIVLTILELEEESRTSASTRSSPESVSNQPSDPTTATNSVNALDQGGFLDHLQGALLEAYRLMSDEAGTSGCPPAVILSPLRLSNLGSLNGGTSQGDTFYLVSPVKQEKQDLEIDVEERRHLGESNEDITESMARFASSALSSQSLDLYSQQPKTSAQECSEAGYSDNEVYRGATQALLNGQIVSKTVSSLKARSYQTQSTMICVDSGTPTKNQSQLPYSVPATAMAVPKFSCRKPETSYPAFDTDINVRSPCLSTPPSTSTLSTPRGYTSLGYLSQSPADYSLSPELPKESYSLPIIKQEKWDWTEPPAVDLQADESLDDLMTEELLARFYDTYDGLGVNSTGRYGEEVTNVPDWQAEKSIGSQSSNDDLSSSMSSSSSSLSSLVTGRISHGSSTSDSWQSADYQVVPTLSDDNVTTGGDAGAERDQFGSQGQVKYDAFISGGVYGREIGVGEE